MRSVIAAVLLAGGLLLLGILLTSRPQARSRPLRANAITDFKYAACGTRHCVKVEAARATGSMILKGLSSEKAKIEIYDREAKIIFAGVSDDLYIDTHRDELYIRQLRDRPNDEYFYDLNEGTMHRFHQRP